MAPKSRFSAQNGPKMKNFENPKNRLFWSKKSFFDRSGPVEPFLAVFSGPVLRDEALFWNSVFSRPLSDVGKRTSKKPNFKKVPHLGELGPKKRRFSCSAQNRHFGRKCNFEGFPLIYMRFKGVFRLFRPQIDPRLGFLGDFEKIDFRPIWTFGNFWDEFSKVHFSKNVQKRPVLAQKRSDFKNFSTGM